MFRRYLYGSEEQNYSAFYADIQFAPRGKLTSLRLERAVGECCVGK